VAGDLLVKLVDERPLDALDGIGPERDAELKSKVLAGQRPMRAVLASAGRSMTGERPEAKLAAARSA